MAWLVSAVAWMSAASLWNPFLPEGPPLGLPTGMTPGSLVPATTASKAPRNASNENMFGDGADYGNGGCGNKGSNGDVDGGGVAMVARGGVAASVGGGVFSPSKSPAAHGGRHLGGIPGRTPGRGGGGGGGVTAAGGVTYSYSAGDTTTPSAGDIGQTPGVGVGGTALSSTPYTGYKGVGGHTGGRGAAGMRRVDTGFGGGSAHGPHHYVDEDANAAAAEVAIRKQSEAAAAEAVRDTVAQALNFQSVPEDFKYDYAAHAAAVARQQEQAAAAAEAAAEAARVPPSGHHRTESCESDVSVGAGGVGGITGATPCLASPEYEAAAAVQQAAAAYGQTVSAGGDGGGRGGLLGGGGGHPHFGSVHHSTTSTVSSVATPPFPGQSAGLKTVRTSVVSTTSSEVSRAVNTALAAAVNDVSLNEGLSPLKGGESPAQRTSRNGRYSANSPLSEVNR